MPTGVAKKVEGLLRKIAVRGLLAGTARINTHDCLEKQVAREEKGKPKLLALKAEDDLGNK